MGGDAVGQGQKRPQPVQAASAEGRDRRPVVGAADDGTDGADDEIGEGMEASAGPARVA
jgi:hypothetical protein